MSENMVGERPAAEGSALVGLRGRRQQGLAELHKDLRVPRYDPPIFVRFKPTDQADIDKANDGPADEPERQVKTNARVLARACIGVFEVLDGREVSVDENDRDGPWPKFDKTLGQLLGVDTEKAVDVVRALYLTDGDIITTAAKLIAWSGYADEDLERELEGN